MPVRTWGTRSACCCHIGVKLRNDLTVDDRTHRAGSALLMGETYTLADSDMEDLSTGTGIAPAGWAELIRELCVNQQALKVVCPVAQDNARGLAGDTVADLMSRAGVPCHVPPTRRRHGGRAHCADLHATGRWSYPEGRGTGSGHCPMRPRTRSPRGPRSVSAESSGRDANLYWACLADDGDDVHPVVTTDFRPYNLRQQ